MDNKPVNVETLTLNQIQVFENDAMSKENNPQGKQQAPKPLSESEEFDNLIDINEDGSASETPDVQEEEVVEMGLEIETLGTTFEDLQEKLAESEKKVLLAHADLENFRRRNLRESADRIKYASLGLMNDALEAVDNLQRAIEAYEKDPNGDGLAEGVKLVAQQVTTVLEKHGCKKIDSVGQTFDPNLHQALQMQASEDFEANTVMMDLRTGYRLHDRVVRPSQVFVSTGKPAAPPSE